MKTILILLLVTYLGAKCTDKGMVLSKDYFLKANKATTLKEQQNFLELSLKECFSYEVKYSLLILKATKSSNNLQKIKYYNSALEALSNIKNQENMVKSEQKRINLILSNLYKNIDKNISNIYNKKANSTFITKREQEPNYWWVIIFFTLLIAWVIQAFFKK